MTRGTQRVGLSRLQAGIIAAVIGLGGLAGLLYFTYTVAPATEMLPVIFVLLFIAVSGLATPAMLFLAGRLRRGGPSHLWPALRQGMWLGLWATLCAWLQWVHLLDWITALLFLAIIVLVEWFVLSRK